MSGPYSTGTVSLDLTGLREGDFAGNGIMGRVMYQLGVRKKADGFWLEMGREEEKERLLSIVFLSKLIRYTCALK